MNHPVPFRYGVAAEGVPSAPVRARNVLAGGSFTKVKERDTMPNDDAPDNDAVKPTSETERPNLSTEHQKDGDARRPSDTLDKGEKTEETIPRKSSLLGED